MARKAKPEQVSEPESPGQLVFALILSLTGLYGDDRVVVSGKTFAGLLLFIVIVLIIGTAFLAVSVLLAELLNQGAAAQNNALLPYTTIATSLVFPAAVFTYLVARGVSLRDAVVQLGLSRDRLTKRMVFLGGILFLAIVLLELGLAAFSQITGIPLPTNVQNLLAGQPLYFLVFAIFITPIDEEILFRGFMVPRIGVVGSAIVFAVLHAAYGSAAEYFGAFVFGLLAGYVFRENRSLYPSVIAHTLVNLLTISQFA